MPKLDRILVPVDFSPSSQAALEYAVFLGERFGSTLHVLHVWEPPPYLWPEAIVLEPGRPEQSLQYLAGARANEQMKELLALPAHRHDVPLVSRIESGNPADVIVSVAQADRFDLIVMGTHGRRGLSRVLMGSVAEKVVRRATCPVLTIHGEARSTEDSDTSRR